MLRKCLLMARERAGSRHTRPGRGVGGYTGVQWAHGGRPHECRHMARRHIAVGIVSCCWDLSQVEQMLKRQMIDKLEKHYLKGDVIEKVWSRFQFEV